MTSLPSLYAIEASDYYDTVVAPAARAAAPDV